MPKVPTYDNFTALPNTLPQVQARAPDMLDVAGQQAQALGQGAMRAGGEVSRIALDAAQQANQVRINDAMNKAVQAKLKLTYDPNEGFVHLRGDAALTRPDGKPLDDEYAEKLEQQINTIAADLGSEPQRLAFKAQAGQLVTQFRGSLTQHVAKEFGEYRVGVQEGTIKTARDQMALSWGDAEAVGQSVNAIKAAVAEQGRLQGLSAQQIEANMVAALSPGHAAVIASAVDAGKLDYAREYMAQVNAELTPAARLDLKRNLDAGDFEKRTQDAADTLYAKYGADTAAALAEARATLSGKEEDQVVTRIKAMDAERVALRERGQKDAADQAWKIYANTGGMGKIPPSVIAAMDGRDLEALRRTARADAEAAQAKREVKTDPSVYYALTVASVQDPNFKSEDLRRYFDRLSPGDRKHFIDLQARTMKPDGGNDVATAQSQITTTVKTLGLKDEDAGLFATEANKALYAAQQQNGGKPLDQAERQRVLDRLVLQGEVVRGKWWMSDPNMRFFEAQAKGQGDQFVPTFNDDQRRKAANALKRQGISNPTPQQVEAVLRATYDFK